MDRFDFSRDGIIHQNVIDFLMERQKTPLTDSKESTILTLIKGSNRRLSVLQSRKSGVCDVVSTMSDHPYRNEMVRLLLHIFGVQ